jgi:hypothetical protein
MGKNIFSNNYARFFNKICTIKLIYIVFEKDKYYLKIIIEFRIFGPIFQTCIILLISLKFRFKDFLEIIFNFILLYM